MEDRISKSHWITGLALLLAFAMLAVGCGSKKSNNSSGSTGGGSVTVNTPNGSTTVKAPTGVPATTDAAIQQCLDQAKTVSDAAARKTAEAACNAAKTGNTGAVKSAAREQCLAVTKAIPDPAARATAEQRCKTATQ